MLYAIFKLYVGWDDLVIASDYDLQSASIYCEPPSDNSITTTECHLVIPPNIGTNLTGSDITNKNWLEVDNDVYSLYSTSYNYRLYNRTYQRYDHLPCTLLVFHPTELPTSNYSQEMMKKFAVKREKELPNKKLLAIIPFMKFSTNKVASIFFDSPYIELLIGDAKIVDKDLNVPSLHYFAQFQPFEGMDRKKHFVTVQAIVSPSNT